MKRVKCEHCGVIANINDMYIHGAKSDEKYYCEDCHFELFGKNCEECDS